MNEYHIGYLAVGGLLGVTISSLLYMMGGRSNKIIRRLGGAAVLALTVNLLAVVLGNWSPWFLLTLGTLFGGFSMGYGANIGYHKVIRRAIYALCVCASGLAFCFVLGGNAWWILIPHVGVGMWSVWLGVKNPVPAAAEEVFVCALLNIGLVMYPFTKMAI